MSDRIVLFSPLCGQSSPWIPGKNPLQVSVTPCVIARMVCCLVFVCLLTKRLAFIDIHHNMISVWINMIGIRWRLNGTPRLCVPLHLLQNIAESLRYLGNKSALSCIITQLLSLLLQIKLCYLENDFLLQKTERNCSASCATRDSGFAPRLCRSRPRPGAPWGDAQLA